MRRVGLPRILQKELPFGSLLPDHELGLDDVKPVRTTQLAKPAEVWQRAARGSRAQ